MNEKPKIIQFESSTACNGKCIICPRPTMKRSQGQMSNELFQKIIKEGMEMGVKHFIPFLNGEPLLFPYLFEWMDYMRDLGLIITIHTNASILTKERAERLGSYTNLVRIVVSFHGATKKTYEKIMGLNYDKVIENTKYLIKVSKARVEVAISEFSETQKEIELFQKIWKGNASITPYWNWHGQKPDKIVARRSSNFPKPCYFLLNYMNIFWDGRVCLCCLDNEGDVILGDANKEHLKNIWNGEKAKFYRQSHLINNFDIPLCRDCNANRF